MKETFGERLKNLRKDKDLGQVQLAAILDVSKSVISLWERNESDPTMSNLVKIAQFFNVSIDFLAGIE
ncbi:MAG: helix-turn-helix transcriptional regulator [Clostridia bacterium]|nr:helix-turn-helix transcriptional regulator [Clostridia bacterium]